MPEPADLRQEAYIQTLRQARKLIQEDVILNHSPTALWPVISNTDQINALAKLAPVIVSTRSLATGGSEVSVETHDLGMRLNYEELPYEWEKERWLQVERIYSQGPTRYVSFAVELHPLDTGQTQVKVEIGLVPKIPLILLKPKLKGIAQRIIEAYRLIDQRLHDQVHHTIAAFLADAQRYAKEIAALEQRWVAEGVDGKLAQGIARYIYTAPDAILARIRPFELAALYQLPRQETLSFFLKRTKMGDFNLSWDLLCPSCQGAKNSAPTLAEVDLNLHCDSCGIDYSTRFDENFELTFYPSATLREINRFTFCAGNPANTAHIAYQQNLFPGQNRELPLRLPVGKYRFRTLTAQGSQPFEVVEKGGIQRFDLVLSDEFLAQNSLQLAQDCVLGLENPRDIFQTLKVDDLAWQADCTTAAMVTSLQAFRDLFATEVLRPGVQIEVTNLSFMFTDLKDSTQMYEEQGDANAFALVQAHFEILLELIMEHEGAIVKTIGDAVMAVFQTPFKALQAAILIQREFAQWNREWNREDTQPEIILKMGLHLGPCIALNLNERLDYFGSTINKAARVQGQSLGQDVVISQDFYQLESIKTLLAQENLTLETFSVNLKGIQGATHLIRFYPCENINKN